MRKYQLILSLFCFALPLFLNAGSSTAVENYNQGLTLYSQKQYERALAHFLLAADEDYNSWQSYEMAGYCYFQMMDKGEALSAFETSLEINPKNARLVKVYRALKAGAADLPLRPVAESSRSTSGT
jgi:tetratricopeptide (TPR) repeat protein